MKLDRSKILITQLILASLSFAISTPAVAQTVSAISSANPAQTSVNQIKKDDTSKKSFSLLAGLEYSQKIAVDEFGQRESGTDLTLNPMYKLSDRFTVLAKGAITKEISGVQNTTYSNTILGLALKGIKINDQLDTTHAFSGILPTNEETQKRDHFYGAVTISNGLSFKNSYIKADYKLGLSKNFHEYNINAEGSPNIEYRLSNSLELNIFVTEKFYLSATGIYKLGRTYGGFERSSFELHSDLNYDFTEQLSMNIGTSNEGNAVKSNGADSNISAYDANSSIARAGVSYTY